VKNILVTGGGGYVGTVLSQRLSKKGYVVKVLDNFMFGDHLDGLEGIVRFKGDIRDKNLVTQALKNTDCVIHLAAISNDPCSELDPELTRQVNYEASKFLIKRSKEMGIERFIFASSSSVYGIKKEPEVTEDLKLEPITLYSELKGKTEEFLLSQGDENFTVIAVRSATVCGYSPRMRLDTILNIFVSCAYNKGKILIEGGQQRRPLIHIDDIVRFYSMLIEVEKERVAGEVFNVSYDNYKVIDVAKLVQSKIPCTIEKTRVTDPRSYSLSTKKVSSVLGFKPHRDISEAVDEVKEAFEQRKIDPDDIRNYNVRLMKSKKAIQNGMIPHRSKLWTNVSRNQRSQTISHPVAIFIERMRNGRLRVTQNA